MGFDFSLSQMIKFRHLGVSSSIIFFCWTLAYPQSTKSWNGPVPCHGRHVMGQTHKDLSADRVYPQKIDA